MLSFEKIQIPCMINSYKQITTYKYKIINFVVRLSGIMGTIPIPITPRRGQMFHFKLHL